MFEYHDPYIKKIPKNRNFYKKIKSINISPKIIKKFDAILIVTDHDIVNWKMVQKNAKLIIDTRNVYKKNYTNVIRA